MATKPSLVPLWDTSNANIVVPSAGKRAQGYLASERPPSGFFNWWKNLVGQWILWLIGSSRVLPWYQLTAISGTTGTWKIAFLDTDSVTSAMAIVVESGVTTIRVTPNGNWALTWSNTTLAAGAAPASVASIAANQVRWVAVGLNGLIQTYEPGGPWTARMPGSNYAGHFTQVIWTGTQFVAVGNLEVQTSPDGITWTRRASTAPAANVTALPAIAHAAGRLVRVGSNNTGGGELWFSDDAAATWQWSASGTAPYTKVLGTVSLEGLACFAALGGTQLSVYPNSGGGWNTFGGGSALNCTIGDVIIANNGAAIFVNGTYYSAPFGGLVDGVIVLDAAEAKHRGFALVNRQVAGIPELARTAVQRWF